MDSSPDMIAAARKRLPALRFSLDHLETWNPPEPFDVILSNAALQWVLDHAALMPRLMRHVAPGGNLAVQMPDNLEEPAHRRMRQVAGAGPWRDKLSGAAGARAERQGPAWYYDLLRPHAARVDVWRTTYHHVLTGGTDAVVEWFKGSGLRPFLAPLDPTETAAYLADYRAGLVEDYPPLPDGTVLLPFPRLFIVATR
jgi:trans-aconitate 2-methyltransferase